MSVKYKFIIRLTRDTVVERGAKGRVLEKVMLFPYYIPVDYQVRVSDFLLSLDEAQVLEDGSVEIYQRWYEHNPSETTQSLLDAGFTEVNNYEANK